MNNNTKRTNNSSTIWVNSIIDYRKNAKFKHYMNILKENGLLDQFPQNKVYYEDRCRQITILHLTQKKLQKELSSMEHWGVLTQSNVPKSNPLLKDYMKVCSQIESALINFDKLLPKLEKDKELFTESKEANKVKSILTAKEAK